MGKKFIQTMNIWEILKLIYTKNLNYSLIMQRFQNLQLKLKIDKNQILIALKIWP